MSYQTKTEKHLINYHEFELKLICSDENRAKHEASNYRKHGFHTRAIEQLLDRFLSIAAIRQ
jgi:hypothetical protein